MKTIQIIFISMVVVSCGTKPTESLSPTYRKEIEVEIESVIDQFFVNYNQKKFEESLKDMLNIKEFRYGVGTEFMDYQSFHKHIQDYLDGVDRHEAKKIKSELIILTKDIAIYSLVASLDMYLKSGKHSTPIFAVTYIFKKVDDKWKIVYMHESD